MPEINLLESTKTQSATIQQKSGMLNKIGIALLVLVLAAYGYLFYASNQMDAKIASVETDQQNVQTQIQRNPDYPQLLASQTKIGNLQILINSHLGWSQLLPKFTDATLQTATYAKFTATTDGDAIITGTVPDFQNLDKLIKGFQLPDFNYIKDVKLVNVGLSSDATNSITFTIDISFNKDILQAFSQAAQPSATPVSPAAPTAPSTSTSK